MQPRGGPGAAQQPSAIFVATDDGLATVQSDPSGSGAMTSSHSPRETNSQAARASQPAAANAVAEPATMRPGP